MEQCDSLSLSSVVASLLLCKDHLTSVEIVNFISKLNCEGFDLDDDNEGIEELFLCVNMNSQCSFMLKEGLSYETVLYDHVTVRDFLKLYSDSKVLDIIQKDPFYGNLYQSYEESNIEISSNLSSNNGGHVSIITKTKRKVKNEKLERKRVHFLESLF